MATSDYNIYENVVVKKYVQCSVFNGQPLRNKTIWEYNATCNAMYYIIHLETSAYSFQYTACIDNIWLYIDAYIFRN